MTANRDTGELEQLDAAMRTAHIEALGALAARIDIEERLRQLLYDAGNAPQESREPGGSDTC
jgi:hypothetical protein